MNSLIKHDLKFEPAWEYFFEKLNKVNALCNQLLKTINFQEGLFYTLLPKEAAIEKIYDFERGWILPQNPILGDKETGYYSITPSIEKALAEKLVDKVLANPEIKLFFDDVLRRPNDTYRGFMDTYGLFHGKEVYYLLDSSAISYENTLSCLRYSSASFWHSMTVVTTANIKRSSNKEISIEMIEEICLKTDLMFITAYDGEGYVFWERNDGINLS